MAEIDSEQARIAGLEQKAGKEEKAKELAAELQKNRETFFTSVDSAQTIMEEAQSTLQDPTHKAYIVSFRKEIAKWLTQVVTRGEQIYRQQLGGKKAKGLETISESGQQINESIGGLKVSLRFLEELETAAGKKADRSELSQTPAKRQSAYKKGIKQMGKSIDIDISDWGEDNFQSRKSKLLAEADLEFHS